MSTSGKRKREKCDLKWWKYVTHKKSHCTIQYKNIKFQKMNSHLANCYQHWKCTKLNWWSRTELKKAALMPQLDMVMLGDVHVFTSSWEPPWKSRYDLESCLQCAIQLLPTSLSGSQSAYLNQHSECDRPWALRSSAAPVRAAFRQWKMAVIWLNSKGLPKNVFKDCFHSHLFYFHRYSFYLLLNTPTFALEAGRQLII